jgi:hypothetical protein
VTQRSPVTLNWLALVFFGSLLACICSIVWIALQSRDALSVQIPLKSGFSTTREFHVPAKAHYRVELCCSHAIPFEQLKRVLRGGNLVGIDMRESDTPMQLRYFSGQPPALGFAREWIRQELAVFAGHPALPYTINCSVVREISELAVTDPHAGRWARSTRNGRRRVGDILIVPFCRRFWHCFSRALRVISTRERSAQSKSLTNRSSQPRAAVPSSFT